MKRFITGLCFCLVSILSSASTERVFVLTDRSSYISGDRVWCSLFCVDENGRLSDLSAVAYLELVSSDGSAAQAKIGLFEGRGAGEFIIPADVPTGNYSLMAYTSLEGGEAAMLGTRPLSVYNTWSLSRVRGGVRPGAAPSPIFETDETDGLLLSVPERVSRGSSLSFDLSGSEADLCVSVFHEDSLSQQGSAKLASFLQAFPVSPKAGGPLEYDGETIRGTVLNAEGAALAILSSSGSAEDIYMARSGSDASLQFHTGNIYGDRELVCEMMNAGDNVRIQLHSPYQNPSASAMSPLQLHESQRSALSQRKRSLSMAYPTDTIARFLPRREDQFLRTEDMSRIHLDDYTRFPTVQEIIVELLPNVRIRNKDRRKTLELAIADGASAGSVFMDQILVMMDGVVISDFNLMLSLDAMLLQDIYIYSKRIVVGSTYFNGAINFVSKKNYVTALDFPSSVCVVDFDGVRYPVAYLGEAPSGDDWRQLLYWHPSLILDNGGKQTIKLTAPRYPGRFCIVAEGLSAGGKAVRAVAHFVVE